MVDTALRAGQDRNTINSLRALSLMSKHGAGRQQEETSRNFEWTNNIKEASCFLVAYPVILTERGEILRNLTLKTGLTSICRNSGIVRPVSSSSSPGLQETSEPVGAGGEVARRVPPPHHGDLSLWEISIEGRKGRTPPQFRPGFGSKLWRRASSQIRIFGAIPGCRRSGECCWLILG
jgi:hypothetical protein